MLTFRHSKLLIEAYSRGIGIACLISSNAVYVKVRVVSGFHQNVIVKWSLLKKSKFNSRFIFQKKCSNFLQAYMFMRLPLYLFVHDESSYMLLMFCLYQSTIVQCNIACHWVIIVILILTASFSFYHEMSWNTLVLMFYSICNLFVSMWVVLPFSSSEMGFYSIEVLTKSKYTWLVSPVCLTCMTWLVIAFKKSETCVNKWIVV